MRNWIKAMSVASVAAGLFAAPVMAAMPSDWDANADAKLTKEEFMAKFKTMDIFAKLDTDKNGILSQAELQAGQTLYGDDFKSRFSASSDADIYTGWNKDGADGLTETEFYEGVYVGYDTNKDNAIQETEFNTLGTDTGTSGFWMKTSS